MLVTYNIKNFWPYIVLAYKLKSSGLLGHKQHPNLIYWLHQISNLTMLAFAALSPYLYVFRSRKVQKCLGQVIYDTFCCCGKAAKSGFSRPQCVIFAKLKFRFSDFGKLNKGAFSFFDQDSNCNYWNILMLSTFLTRILDKKSWRLFAFLVRILVKKVDVISSCQNLYRNSDRKSSQSTAPFAVVARQQSRASVGHSVLFLQNWNLEILLKVALSQRCWRIFISPT